MAVTLLQSAQSFIGLSTDTKPSDATIAPSARFFEADTGRVYLYDGRDWYLNWLPATALSGGAAAGGDQLSLLTNIDRNLKLMLTILQAALGATGEG
jgi:hypothetical protein